jgi:hypothetical protein
MNGRVTRQWVRSKDCILWPAAPGRKAFWSKPQRHVRRRALSTSTGPSTDYRTAFLVPLNRAERSGRAQMAVPDFRRISVPPRHGLGSRNVRVDCETREIIRWR